MLCPAHRPRSRSCRTRRRSHARAAVATPSQVRGYPNPPARVARRLMRHRRSCADRFHRTRGQPLRSPSGTARRTERPRTIGPAARAESPPQRIQRRTAVLTETSSPLSTTSPSRAACTARSGASAIPGALTRETQSCRAVRSHAPPESPGGPRTRRAVAITTSWSVISLLQSRRRSARPPSRDGVGARAVPQR